MDSLLSDQDEYPNKYKKNLSIDGFCLHTQAHIHHNMRSLLVLLLSM